MNEKQIIIIVLIFTVLCNLCYLLLTENWECSFYSCLAFVNILDMSCDIQFCCAVLLLSIIIPLKFFISRISEDNYWSIKILKELNWKCQLCVIGGIFSFLCVWKLSAEELFRCVLSVMYISIIFVGLELVFRHEEIDFAHIQDPKSSIGAYWAIGAFKAYYEKSLKKFRERLRNFEANNPDVKFSTKDLVLIAPLSCKIDGLLSDKSDNITFIGNLEPIECDQGANYNRRLKTSVYKIFDEKIQTAPMYIAGEYPSPLGTLWNERHIMDEKVRLYIQDCFLRELKENLLKNWPVIILEYDDQNNSECQPLHQFIVSSLLCHQQKT